MRLTKHINCNHSFKILGAMVAFISLISCVKEEMGNLQASDRKIAFEVSSDDKQWNELKSSICHMDGYTDSIFLHMTEEVIPSTTQRFTKGSHITEDNFYTSIGVSAYTFKGEWDDSLTPNWMYNEEITEESGWNTDIFWPSEIYNIQFFAYAPYNCKGLRLANQTQSGYPTFDFTVDNNVSNQTDLIVATSKVYSGHNQGAAELEFKHALTSVRLVTGNDFLPGKISKVSLKGVLGSGRYNYGSGQWAPIGTRVTYSQDIDTQVDGTPGQPITEESATFMMIPQTLPSGAVIEIIYIDDLTSQTHTLSASIAGTTWESGKMISYRLSTSSIQVSTVLDVEMPTFTYTGGSRKFGITSYSTITTTNGTQTIAQPWEAEFVEEDGNGGYITVQMPSWISTMVSSDNGNINKEEYTLTVQPQTLTYETPHDDIIKATPPVNGTFDLSTNGGTEQRTTSNCYIVNAPGTYSFPLVYGNAIKNGENNTSAYITSIEGLSQNFVNHLNVNITDPYIYNNSNCTPSDAVLMWQDAPDLVTGISLDAQGENILFTVNPETIKQGNAVIAVRNASSTVMWSWHIWVTDYKTDTDLIKISDEVADYYIMPLNVGECYVPAEIYKERTATLRFTQSNTNKATYITLRSEGKKTEWGTSPTYQWGYKNPLIPWSGVKNTSTNKTWYNRYGTASTTLATRSKSGLSVMIKEPEKFHTSNSNMSHKNCNLWNNDVTYDSSESVSGSYEIPGRMIKTIYDPCPRGYTVIKDYVIKCIDNYKPETSISEEYRTQYNINGQTLSLSISGSRDMSTGTLSINGWAKSWTSLHRVPIGQRSGACDAHAYGVRPIKEL